LTDVFRSLDEWLKTWQELISIFGDVEDRSLAVLMAGSYELFVYQHVRLLLALSVVPVWQLGQEDETLIGRIYEAAMAGVRSGVEGLKDGGGLRFASQLGVIMIV
jgi:hypothetical protein